MSETNDATTADQPSGRELVGILKDRPTFEKAVERLKDAGFQHADLSVLETHESVDAARPAESENRWRDAVTAVVGDLKYEGPLVSAGLIALATGPVGTVVAGFTAAGVGAMAIREALDEVTAEPHRDAFVRALEAGSIALWVRADTDAREATARRILEEMGADNVHLVHDVGTATAD